jgi:hypothetical protein
MGKNEIDPMLCDSVGKPLEYDDGREVWVRLRDEVDEDPWNVGDRTGIVRSVPKVGTEWYGFPLVQFRGAKKNGGYHVPNSTVEVLNAEAVPARVDPEVLRELRLGAAQFRTGRYVSTLSLVELIEKL